MIPSSTWFPTSLQERASWVDNWATQMSTLGAGFGFSVAEIAAFQEDNTVMQFLAQTRVDHKVQADQIRQYQIIVTEGRIGDPTPAFPANLTLALPEVIPTGMFQRIAEGRDRILAHPTYTNEAGAAFQILSSSPGPLPESELKPTITVFESHSDFTFSADVSRMKQDAFKVQIQRSGESTWADGGFATRNPIVVTVTPTDPGKPERILVRPVLIKSNQPIGTPGDPVFVTLNP